MARRERKRACRRRSKGEAGRKCVCGGRQVRCSEDCLVKLPQVLKMMLERHKLKKDAAAAASRLGRAISDRMAASERLAPHTRA